MNENIELRNAAWRILWNKKWFWKLLGAYILLQIVTQAVLTVLNGVLTTMGVCNLDSVSKEDMAGFSPAMLTELISSTFLFAFIAFIMTGISNYGGNKLLNLAADDDSGDWMKATFSGFKIPLDLAWLLLRVSVIYLLYLIPALAVLVFGAGLFLESGFVSRIVASEPLAVSDAVVFSLFLSGCLTVFFACLCIPFYKYRYLFRIKADNPDLGAGECLRRCRLLTSGEKWRMFRFDCSYWKIFLLPLIGCMALIFTVALTVGGRERFLNPEGAEDALCVIALLLTLIAAYFVIIVSSLICGFYNGVGQSLLYRKISTRKNT